MTESDKQLIINLWESGQKTKEIVQMLPYDEDKSYYIIKKLKKDGYLGKKIKTKEKVKTAYNSGITNPYKLAEMYGVAVGTIKNILYRLNLTGKRPKKNYKVRETPKVEKLCERTQNIVDAIKLGFPIKKIAQMYGVSRQWVYSIQNTQIKRIKRKIYVKEKNND